MPLSNIVPFVGRKGSEKAAVTVCNRQQAELQSLEKAGISQVDCIFQQPWWLEAVAPGSWGIAEVQGGGGPRARLPYVIRRGPLGLNFISMPRLTPYLGPWLAPGNGKNVKQLADQKELLNGLMDQLPPCDYFHQSCHYSLKNWLPFYWRGFQATVAYTYYFDGLEQLDQVWNGMRDKTRGQIRKAERQLTVRALDDVDKFLEVQQRTYIRQGKPLKQDIFDTAKRIDDACAPRQARKIFFAEDDKGQAHAAIYTVSDENCVYGLMSGETTELRDAAGASLVIWEALKFASASGKNFDICGSVIERIERFLRGFGGQQKPYFVISKMSRRGKIVMGGRNLLNSIWER